MIYKSKDIAYRFILLFDIPSKKEYVYFVFDECRVQHETLCLDRPNYQDFRIIVLFVLKLIASTIDIYPLLPPYKQVKERTIKQDISNLNCLVYGLHSQTIAHIES